MALAITAAAAVLGIAFLDHATTNAHVEKVSTKRARSQEGREAFEDFDSGMLSNINVRPASSIITQEIGGIIRSDNYGDIYNVKNNALDYASRARVKNKALGEANFCPDNRSTVLIPSYGTSIPLVSLNTDETIKNYRLIPNAQVDRPDGKIYTDDRAWVYRDPYGENITPFNLPRDPIFDIAAFGNPWGPTGIYNKFLRRGGDRLNGTADYEPKTYEQKRVSFSLPVYRS